MSYLEKAGKKKDRKQHEQETVTLTSLLHSKTYHLRSAVLFKQCFLVIACCLLRNFTMEKCPNMAELTQHSVQLLCT